MPHGNAVGVTPSTAADGHDSRNPLALEDTCSETLHTTHAAAHARVQLPDAHPVKKPELSAYHVLHGQNGESGSISLP